MAGMFTGGASRRARWARPGRTGRGVSFPQMVKDLAQNPTILSFEIFTVVVLSVLFETFEHWISKRLKKGDKMGSALVAVLFKEITLIGFVTFVLFLTLHTGTAERLAKDYPLIASFETVRMIMFMVVNALVVQTVFLWNGGRRIIKEWGSFERARSFGADKFSLESMFIKAGYLIRVPNPGATRDMTLLKRKSWTFGTTFLGRMFRAFFGGKIRKLIILRAIRHEFLFPSVKNVARVPDPGVFSFESYLQKRLGRTLIQLITVDTVTWFSTLVLLAVPMYFAQAFTWVSLEAWLAAFAWALVLAGCIVIVFIEEDMYRLTPEVPSDLRLTLKIFARDTLQMLRRAKLPSWKGRSLSGRRFRPDLGDAEGLPRPELDRPLAMRTPLDGGMPCLLSQKTYLRLGQLLKHFQAINAASLIIVSVVRPAPGPLEQLLYGLSWFAWLFMLSFVLPLIVRRITMLTSIEQVKDQRAIRVVTLEYKDSLLKDFQRLIQLIGFERRAVLADEAWTRKGDATWGRRQQIQAVMRGNRLFESLPETDKIQIWAGFGSWDPKNTGSAEIEEVEEVFRIMGFPETSPRTAANLLRLVDFDATGKLNWMKFKAIFGLATMNQPRKSVLEDFEFFFNAIDTDRDGVLTHVELGKGFARMQISIDAADVENLLFSYYGIAKPKITIEEFLDFITAEQRMMSIQSVYDYNHG